MVQVCAAPVVEQFAHVSRASGFLYIYPLLAQARLHPLPTATREKLLGELGTFFPFDPYRLPRSARWVEEGYREWGEVAIEGDDDEDEEVESQSHFSPFASHHGSPRKNMSQSAFGFSSSYPSSQYYFAEKAPTTTPSGSCEDEPSNALQLHESPFEDDADEVIEESRKTACLIRKVSKPKKSATLEAQTEKDEEDESSPALRSLEEEGGEDEHAST